VGVAPAEQVSGGPMRVGALPLSALTPTAPPTVTFTQTAIAPTTPPQTDTPPPSTATVTVTPAASSTSAPTPVAGARQIAFHSGAVDGAKFIHVANVDGSQVISLTAGISPAWSPDGSQLVFVSDLGGNLDIFLMNADGSAVTNLTQTPTNDDSPAWTPDGQFIIFSSMRDGNAELYQMRADGTDVVRLTRTPLVAEIQPAVSANGEIVYAALSVGVTQLWMMQADGSEARLLEVGGGFCFRPHRHV